MLFRSELHIPIDYIAGTSMGSIIGGLYACGYTPDAMEKLVGSINWAELFQDAPERPHQSFRQKEDDYEHLAPFEFGLDVKKRGIVLPPGLIAGNKLGFVLQSATLPCSSVTSYDDLRIPFRAVATDVQTGQPYVMGSGSLGRSIRASMAIPAVFTPVEIDGHLLIDGGESENLPVQTVRAMGADVVIAVSIGSSGAGKAEKPQSIGGMLSRLIDLPFQQNTMASAKLADIVITPDLEPYTAADFVTGLKMVPLGYRGALAAKGKLAQWSVPAEAYAAWKARHDDTLPPPPFIDRIEIDGGVNFDRRRIEKVMRTRAGQVLDTKTLAADVTRIYSLGNFEVVNTAIENDGRMRVLHITAVQKSWGPTYLKVGLNLATDFGATTEFGVTSLVDATNLNRLGGQWKTAATIGSPTNIQSHFYQPLTYAGHLFLSPYVGWRAYLVQDWGSPTAPQHEATFQVISPNVGMDLGYDFGAWGEFRVGYLRANRALTRLVGVPSIPEHLTENKGGLNVRFRVDQLDNVNVPHAGYLAEIDYFENHTYLGSAYAESLADSDFKLFNAKFAGVKTIGRWTGQLRLQYGSGLGTNQPFTDRFTLGGLFLLSGRSIRELRGNKDEFGAALLYYQLTSSENGPIRSVSVGGSLETGKTWVNNQVGNHDLNKSGSIFFITDTLLGPFFFGYGRSTGPSGNVDSFYLYLNRPFQ